MIAVTNFTPQKKKDKNSVNKLRNMIWKNWGVFYVGFMNKNRNYETWITAVFSATS